MITPDSIQHQSLELDGTYLVKVIIPEAIKRASSLTNDENLLSDMASTKKRSKTLLREYIKANKIEDHKASAVIIDSDDYYYPLFLELALAFYDLQQIPTFLDYQIDSLKGNKMIANRQQFVAYLKLTAKSIVAGEAVFFKDERINIIDTWARKEAKNLRIKYSTIRVYKNNTQPKEIKGPLKQAVFISEGANLNSAVNLLLPYFPAESSHNLKQIFSGYLNNVPVFHGNQNQFTEFIKRLKYNGVISGSLTELKKWIKDNFKFQPSILDKPKMFSEASVRDVLSKNQAKFEPKFNNRIGTNVFEWIDYKYRSPNKRGKLR